MSRLYYFSLKKKEIGKKDLAFLNDLKDFTKLFFVEDACNVLVFQTKKALLECLKEKFETTKITTEDFKRFKKEIKNL